MATIRQRLRHRRIVKTKKTATPALQGNPQRRGVCVRVWTVSPKKPNSGDRKVARVALTTGKTIMAYIPGELHSLQQHNLVLVRGGGVRDIPGCGYTIIRGKLDATPVRLRKSKRSKYGLKDAARRNR